MPSNAKTRGVLSRISLSSDGKSSCRGFTWEVSLCSCCGVEPIPSGYRWAPLHCDRCRPRVLALNQTLGRCAIPVGAHSIMNGVALSVDERDPAGIERFLTQLLAFFEAVEHLESRAQRGGQGEPARTGFALGVEVRLSDHLKAARAGIDPDRAFERVCAHFASRN